MTLSQVTNQRTHDKFVEDSEGNTAVRIKIDPGQVSTITPPSAITGYATSSKQDTLLTELQLKADLTETQPVSLASVPSHAVTNAGTFAVQAAQATAANLKGQIEGTTAHDGTPTPNPVMGGMHAVAHGASPTAVAAADLVRWL